MDADTALSYLKGRRVAIAIAHPDDEVMWFSSLLLKKTEVWDIYVESLYDEGRTENWYKVCERLNLIPNVGFPSGYSVLITHNEHGEYGHIKHKKVHQMARDSGSDLLVSTYPQGEKIDVEAKRSLIEMYDEPTKRFKHRWQALMRHYKWKREGFRYIRLSS